jgi:putative transposase
MSLLMRAFIVKEINDWDETALHDSLQAHPSFRRRIGFENLPNQSTFWRACCITSGDSSISS